MQVTFEPWCHRYACSSTRQNISQKCNRMDSDHIRKMYMSSPRRQSLKQSSLDVDPGPPAVHIRPSADVFDDRIDLPNYILSDAKSETQPCSTDEKNWPNCHLLIILASIGLHFSQLSSSLSRWVTTIWTKHNKALRNQFQEFISQDLSERKTIKFYVLA